MLDSVLDFPTFLPSFSQVSVSVTSLFVGNTTFFFFFIFFFSTFQSGSFLLQFRAWQFGLASCTLLFSLFLKKVKLMNKIFLWLLFARISIIQFEADKTVQFCKSGIKNFHV